MLKKNNIMKYTAAFIFSLALKTVVVMWVLAPMTAQAKPAPQSFADMADQLLPTVVNISSTQKMESLPDNGQSIQPDMPMFPEGSPFEEFFEDFFDRHRGGNGGPNHLPPASLGSGFIIDAEKGYIVTNNHVIKDADDIKITLHDDTILPAEIVGVDEKTDLAVLKADLSDQKITDVNLGDSTAMRVGDWVLAIGNPFGLGGTVTAGIISARQRDINAGPYDDFIQTDASINRGNSGGPMFNLDGDVIGINTAIFSPSGGSVGIGFAIPSSLAKPIIDQLIEFGRTRRGWLGVRIQTVTDEIAESLGLKKAAGALVADVTPTSPAEKAGLKAGDVILVFDGKPVRDMRSLPRIVAETPIGKDVKITIWRASERVALKAVLGELEKAEENGLLAQKDHPHMNDPEKPLGHDVPLLGLTVMELNDVMRESYGIAPDVSGLVITAVDPQSSAAEKGLIEGDVIVDINQSPANNFEDLEKEIQNAQDKDRDAVLLLVNRQGDIQFIAVSLKQLETKNDEDKGKSSE